MKGQPIFVKNLTKTNNSIVRNKEGIGLCVCVMGVGTKLKTWKFLSELIATFLLHYLGYW